jgi:ATP-binding cassette subfamily F protein 3
MLNIQSVTIRLGGKAILEGASAALPPGSKVGLIGRNGAGKSTLMKAMIGQIEPDDGSIDMPNNTRLGYLAQDAPSGSESPFDKVLSADKERARLLEESETCVEPHRLGEIHERLNAIDAYSAPARAGRILVGLGFDEDMQARPLDSFSGGWKMRVALAALLFSKPDLLLLDEPSNHLDLEATLWLENFLKDYSETVIIISHERDLLNKVVDHILHLEHGKTTLYPGGYDQFERLRAERLAQLGAAREKQAAEREKLQAFVDRWRAKASKAKQAQSRMKALEKMSPIAAAMEDPSLSFTFPDPEEMRPPLITLDMASVGYGETVILRGLNLRVDPDDRIALLGRNGNGKTTLARLLTAQLKPMAGEMNASNKMTVGYFTQYQVEELETDVTPLEHMTRKMVGKTPGAVRAQLGRFGFSGDRATQKVASLSGGERARLALALITRDAPSLLVLDEPTNHLDVDAREALVQALNAYSGAVVVVSHDRHMIEMVADRLVLIGDGGAREYDGTLDDYTRMILGKSDKRADGDRASAAAPRTDKKAERKAAAERREQNKALRDASSKAEKDIERLTAQRAEVDRAMFEPSSATGKLAQMSMTELMKHRADIQARLDDAEALWIKTSEKLEQAAA